MKCMTHHCNHGEKNTQHCLMKDLMKKLTNSVANGHLNMKLVPDF